MTGGLLTIGKLAAGVGVTLDTLRYYERLGLLPPPPRTRGGYRLYEPALAERVAFICKAKALGLTLEEVREVLRVAADGTPPCEHVRTTLSSRLREVEIRPLVHLRDHRIPRDVALGRDPVKARGPWPARRYRPQEGGVMNPTPTQVHSLCPACSECPTVEIYADGTVRIGEAPNTVILARSEWNELVRAIKSDTLVELS